MSRHVHQGFQTRSWWCQVRRRRHRRWHSCPSHRRSRHTAARSRRRRTNNCWLRPSCRPRRRSVTARRWRPATTHIRQVTRIDGNSCIWHRLLPWLFPVIWGRRYSWLASSPSQPCLLCCPLSAPPLSYLSYMHLSISGLDTLIFFSLVCPHLTFFSLCAPLSFSSHGRTTCRFSVIFLEHGKAVCLWQIWMHHSCPSNVFILDLIPPYHSCIWQLQLCGHTECSVYSTASRCGCSCWCMSLGWRMGTALLGESNS